MEDRRIPGVVDASIATAEVTRGPSLLGAHLESVVAQQRRRDRQYIARAEPLKDMIIIISRGGASMTCT